MPRVINFEIYAENPERAKFNGEVFDWKMEKWQGIFNYWPVATGEDKEPGINVAIMEQGNFKITFNRVGVSSVDEFLKKIVVAGRKVVVMPKGAVSIQRYLAHCSDTEDNVFGVIQYDPSAK